MHTDTTRQANEQKLRISSYRLAYLHAPKRARHEDDEILDCVFCRYSEGVALMADIVGYLNRLGFPITSSDERSFTLDLTRDFRLLSSGSEGLDTKQALRKIVSGSFAPKK